MSRALPPGVHAFRDLAEGDRIETGETEVTPAMIDAFAAVSGDRFEIHMDEAAAHRHGFKGRVAHGLLVLSLVDGLKNAAPAQLQPRASLGWDWKFSAPVLAGDRVRAVITIETRTATSDGRHGILTLGVRVLNQRDEVVQKGTNRLMVYA